MAFFRPEIRQAVERFRDAIIGVGISLLGIYWALAASGFMAIVGTSLAVAGALLVFAGIQRGRFRSGSEGPGVVRVDEGQVTYYGPFEGGSLIIDELEKVRFDATTRPRGEWILKNRQGIELRIPVDAEGAETLFDVFTSLEGLQTEKMLSAINDRQARQVVIWQAERAVLH